MKLLLDTHTFIWWEGKSSKLSVKAFDAIYDPDNEVLLSVVSVWEMQIKANIGKMQFRVPLAQLLHDQQEENDLTILPILLDHVLALDILPTHHKDPFDRLLIAQAQVEKAIILTVDEWFKGYTVKLLW